MHPRRASPPLQTVFDNLTTLERVSRYVVAASAPPDGSALRETEMNKEMPSSSRLWHQPQSAAVQKRLEAIRLFRKVFQMSSPLRTNSLLEEHLRTKLPTTMGDTVNSLKDRANAHFKGKRAAADLLFSQRNVALPTVLNSPAEHILIRTPCQPFAAQSTSTPKPWSCTAKL